MKKGLIIGIAGKAGAGKDTVASMLSILYDKECDCSYNDWVNRNPNPKCLYIKNQIHFADALKRLCANLLDINEEAFYDRYYKDDAVYLYKGRLFTELPLSTKYRLITIDDLNAKPMSYYAAKYNIAFTLRTFMQYIGTNIFRKQIDNDFWVNKTIKEAKKIADKDGLVLIPDVRFDNESDAIKRMFGKVIMINREEIELCSHESEQLANINPNYTIDNSGNLFNLFYKVKNLAVDLLI